MRRARIYSTRYPSMYAALGLLAAVVCLGPAAAQAQTNTATGIEALANVTTGIYNTADGYYALNKTDAGSNNTASGGAALFYNTTGSNNTADGAGALFNNTTGNNNIGSGLQALYVNKTGSNNTAVGANALYSISGKYNIALGNNAGKKTTSGNTNIYIGNPGVGGSESKVIRIGKAQTMTFIAGISGTPQSGATVVVKSNGKLGVVASSARYKQDIEPLASDVAEKLEQLRPVSYRYKTEPEATHYGLIAEEVDQVMPELVVRDGKHRPDSVQYMELVPLLLQQWQAQQAENARQRALIERQEAEMEQQRALIDQLAADVAELRSTRLAAN